MGFYADHKILGRISVYFVIQGFQKKDLRRIAGEILIKTGRDSKRACPLKPLMVIWLVVAMALYRTQSIPNVFERLLWWTRKNEPNLGRRPVTPEALCHARERLGFLPLQMLHRQIVEQILSPVIATFCGLVLWAIDGTELTVPDTTANLKAFGKHHSQRGEAAYPQVRGVTLTALATHQIHDAILMPSSKSERAALPELMKSLGSKDLLLLDRGLSSFGVLRDCLNRGANYLVRISSIWKPRHLSNLGPGDTLVELTPCGVAKSKLLRKDKRTKIIARMLVFRVGDGSIVRLLTSLVDPAIANKLELAQQYYTRWECELTFKELKVEFLAVTDGKQKTHLRSKSPDLVRQEIWGAIIAHTLVRQLMVEGAEEAGVSPLDLSFVDSLELIKHSLPILQSTVFHRQIQIAILLKDIGRCLIDRPRRARQVPRKVKRKMSNFQLKGPTDREKTLDLTITFIQSFNEISHE